MFSVEYIEAKAEVGFPSHQKIKKPDLLGPGSKKGHSLLLLAMFEDTAAVFEFLAAATRTGVIAPHTGMSTDGLRFGCGLLLTGGTSFNRCLLAT